MIYLVSVRPVLSLVALHVLAWLAGDWSVERGFYTDLQVIPTLVFATVVRPLQHLWGVSMYVESLPN